MAGVPAPDPVPGLAEAMRGGVVALVRFAIRWAPPTVQRAVLYLLDFAEQ